MITSLLLAVVCGTAVSMAAWTLACAGRNRKVRKDTEEMVRQARFDARIAQLTTQIETRKGISPPPTEIKMAWCDLCEQIKPETEFDWYETIWRCQDCLCVRDNGFDECNCKRCYRQWLEAELDWESIYQQERRWIEDQAAKHVGRAKRLRQIEAMGEVEPVEIRADNNGCTTTHYSDGSVVVQDEIGAVRYHARFEEPLRAFEPNGAVVLEAFGEAEPVGYVHSTRIRQAVYDSTKDPMCRASLLPQSKCRCDGCVSDKVRRAMYRTGGGAK